MAMMISRGCEHFDFSSLNLSEAIVNENKTVDKETAMIEGYFLWELCRAVNVVEIFEKLDINFGNIIGNYKDIIKLESGSPTRFEKKLMEYDFKTSCNDIRSKACDCLKLLAEARYVKDIDCKFEKEIKRLKGL